MRLAAERSDEMKARIRAAVEEALRARGISARRASLDVVGHDGLIRDIRAGRLPGVDRLAALFDYLGIAFRLGPPSPPQQPGFAEPVASFAPEDGEYVPIPWHPLAVQAGPVPIAFARGWLERERLDPAGLAALAAEDEVLALVEPYAPQRGGPALWGLRRNGRLRLAMVQFAPRATVIFGPDPGGLAEVLVGEERARLPLLGRVVWSGRREG